MPWWPSFVSLDCTKRLYIYIYNIYRREKESSAIVCNASLFSRPSGYILLRQLHADPIMVANFFPPYIYRSRPFSSAVSRWQMEAHGASCRQCCPDAMRSCLCAQVLLIGEGLSIIDFSHQQAILYVWKGGQVVQFLRGPESARDAHYHRHPIGATIKALRAIRPVSGSIAACNSCCVG